MASLYSNEGSRKIPMIPIKSGKGVWLYDYDGTKYLDAISSWWVNLFGHSNAYINKSIKSQLSQLEHVLLAGFTHEPAINLSERLIKLTPPKSLNVSSLTMAPHQLMQQ